MAHRVDNLRSLAAFPSESAEPDPQPQLGSLIRTARLAGHMTLEGAAARAGLDPQRVLYQFRREYPEYEAPTAVAPPIRSVRPWLPVAGSCAVLLIGGFAAAVPVFKSPPSRPEAVNAASTIVSEVAPPPTMAFAPAPIPVAVQTSIPVHDAAAPVLLESDERDGELAIVSTPAGARVTVNGIARGNTPVRVRFLPPGTYTIRVIEAGYSIAERRTTLTPERPRASVVVSLREAPTASRVY